MNREDLATTDSVAFEILAYIQEPIPSTNSFQIQGRRVG